MPDFKYFPQPKYAPKLDPDYKHDELAEVYAAAALLGFTLQPWQMFVVKAATQYQLIDGERVYKYRFVLITVPRQSGKTTMIGPLACHRMLTNKNLRSYFTAQTGSDAGDKMRELIELVEKTPAKILFKHNLSNGREGLKCPGSGSAFHRFSPTESSIHGKTPQLVFLDEIWKFNQIQGNSLMAGIRPTGQTLGNRQQIWMISTKGTFQSAFMNEWIEKGRAGTDPNLAFFEWSMPDGLDPYDPATWWTFHPALGNTIDESAIAAETDLAPGEFMRAYMNRLTAAEDPLIPSEDLESMAHLPEIPPALSDCTITFDVAPDFECAAVVATWRDKGDKPCFVVLKQAPGTWWLERYLRKLHAATKVVPAADAGGPTRTFLDKIADLEPRGLNLTERILADGQLLTAARDEHAIRHDGSLPFRSAWSNAVLKFTNGSPRFDRDKSTAPIPSLIAASVGLFLTDHQPAPEFVAI